MDRQFTQLEQLENRHNPNFVEEVLTLYFRDSTTLLATVEQTMLVELTIWSFYFPIDFPFDTYNFFILMMMVTISCDDFLSIQGNCPY